MLPTQAQIGMKASLEILSMTILSVPMFYVHMIAGTSFTPYHRGFFCDDQNLKHPYVKDQTVPMMVCFALWMSILFVFILFIELLRSRTMKYMEFPIFGVNVPWIMIELYRHFGYLILGGISSIVFTDLSKFTIGRLRPHFLTLCQPAYTDEICKDEHGYPVFVTLNDSLVCLGMEGDTTEKMLKDARMSFMSGHSSFSFYCATFLVFYLQARLNKFPETSLEFVNRSVKILKVIRPFVQFGISILAFWIALTRISDYFHHPMDVVTGCIVGIVFGFLALGVSNICHHQAAYWKHTAKLVNTKNNKKTWSQGENGTISDGSVKIKSFEDFIK